MTFLLLLLTFFLPPAERPTERKTGNPLEHLPLNIQVLAHFGERPDFSPDNQHVAFMAKSFGDAMMIDLKTRAITCLTCNVPGATFLRVMHLSTGDYILIGPDHFEDIQVSRDRDNELWFLSKERGARPVKLGQKMSEGAAISKKALKISYSQTWKQAPDLPQGASRLIVADLDLSGDTPKLTGQKTVYENKDHTCTLEAQDFYDNDHKLTFSCYEPQSRASVMGIDLQTGKVTNFSKIVGYNEPEGIFPDGLYTTVESDRQCEWMGGVRGNGNLDLWKLKLDGSGDATRLTNFNDFTGWKATNPVISTDGKFMSFQIGKTGEAAGVGYGVLLYRLK